MASLTPEELKAKDDMFEKYFNDLEGKLNEGIIKHPQFKDLFFKELNYLFRKTYNYNYDISISDDGNKLSITTFSPVYDCREEFAGNNKSFIRTMFFLKDENLVCDYNQGTLFDRDKLEEIGIKTNLKYESKLETNYSMRFFDKDGIEYSDNSYSDTYHFDDKSEDIDLRERTMSSFHKPTFHEYKLPTMAIHVMKANTRNTYRKHDSLAIIHSNIGTATIDGYKNIVCALYTAHEDYPEMLRGATLIARTNENNEEYKFEIKNDYAANLKEAYDKAKREFKEKVKDSRLKDYNENIYNALVKQL